MFCVKLYLPFNFTDYWFKWRLLLLGYSYNVIMQDLDFCTIYIAFV